MGAEYDVIVVGSGPVGTAIARSSPTSTSRCG